MLKSIWTCLLAVSWCFPHSSFSQGSARLMLKKLPETINTSYEESKPITTRNGDSLYFARSQYPGNRGGEFAGQDVWMSTRDGSGVWSSADNKIPGLNNIMPNIIIGIAGDDSGIFHLGYALEGDQRSVTVHFSAYGPGGYSDSELIGIKPIKVGEDYHDLYMHPDGDVLIISMSALNSIGKEDLYACQVGDDGNWTDPIHMGPVVNTRGFEISPFLSNDKRTLYFSSDGFTGYGDADIYRSNRAGRSWQEWSPPENIGPPYNSKKFDAYYFENGIGEAYLASNRANSFADLYMVMEMGSDELAMDDVDGLLEGDSAGITDASPQSGLNGAVRDTLRLILTFDHDKSSLEEQELEKLHVFLSGLEEPYNFELLITGFTDDTGSEAYNEKLSYRRAIFVARDVKKKGFPRDQLQMAGMGVYRKEDASQLKPEEKRRVEVIAVRLPAQKQADP